MLILNVVYPDIEIPISPAVNDGPSETGMQYTDHFERIDHFETLWTNRNIFLRFLQILNVVDFNGLFHPFSFSLKAIFERYKCLKLL